MRRSNRTAPPGAGRHKWLSRLCLGGGFGTEDALEAWADELDADVALAGLLVVGYVDDATVGGEVFLHAPRSGAGEWDTDLEVGADGHVEAGDERGAVAAKIFAGSLFLEGDAARIAAANLERQAHGDSTFGALLGRRQAGWDHGLIPPFRRSRYNRDRPPARLRCARKSVLRFPALHWVYAPRARFCEARRRSQRHEKTSKRTASFFPQHRAGWQH